MKRKEIISALFFAMIMAAPSGSVLAQSTGGTQSERSGTDTQTPLPPKSPSSGSGDESNMQKTPTTPRKSTSKMKDDKSVGGSQSERSGTDTQTPLPNSKSTGKTSTTQRKSTGNMKDDKSVGGSQSERSGTDTQTPLPPKTPLQALMPERVRLDSK